MGRIEQFENAIKALSATKLHELRAWFAEFEAANWDRRLDADFAEGRLDMLAERALAEHAAASATRL